MNKVLIAVDDTKTSRQVVASFHNLVRQPESIVLLYTQRLEGKSLMIDMLGDAEMTTLKEMLKGTEHKERLDRKAEMILNSYRKELEEEGAVNIKAIVRSGHPAEEILRVADEEEVGLIILGFNGRKGLDRIIAGNLDVEVKRKAKVPVLVAKRPNICEEPYTWRDALAAISVTATVVFGLYLLGIVLYGRWFLR